MNIIRKINEYLQKGLLLVRQRGIKAAFQTFKVKFEARFRRINTPLSAKDWLSYYELRAESIQPLNNDQIKKRFSMKRKICVTSINTPDYEVLAEKTWHQNKVLYAKKHGYDTFQKNSDFKGVQFGFEKIVYLIELLKTNQHDYLFYSDSDSIITNFNKKVESIIDIADRDIYVTADCNGLNFGVLIIKNSKVALDYLEFIWSKYEIYKNSGFYEQQVGMDYQRNFLDIMLILPQRVMNSYLSSELYPNQSIIDRTGNLVDFQKNDFVVHWPATNLEKRLELFERFTNEGLIIKCETNEVVKIDKAHASLITGLVVSNKPKKLLEFGIGGGQSTDAILEGLFYNSQEYDYTVVDNWCDWGGRCPSGVKERYENKLKLVVSDEREYVFGTKEKYDFIMSDGDHNRTDQWFEYVYDNLLADNGILIYHDINLVDQGMFHNLRSIYYKIVERQISHHLFNLNSRPEERCQRGLLVLFKH